MIGIALFAAAVGGIAFSFGGGNKMPYHEGKSLQEWFDSLESPAMYSEEDPNVRAIVAIGSDAVPFLMREFGVSESPWVEGSRSLWSRTGLVRRPYTPARFRQQQAYYALRHLRSKASSALPDLIKLAEDESHPSCVAAIRLLGTIQSNPATVVVLLQKVIANPRAPGFVAAIEVLSKLGTNASPALPRLKEIEADAAFEIVDRVLAASAIVAINAADRRSLEFIVAQLHRTNACGVLAVEMLGLLGTNASPALPSMRKLVQSESDSYWHSCLSNAIHALETACGTESTGRQ